MAIEYSLNTLYIAVAGILVMWMAAGFSMLEAGLVRSKNTVEILAKNIILFAVASFMYLIVGYGLMYPGDVSAGKWFPDFAGILGHGANAEDSGGDYSQSADFFFQVVFVATAMSIVSGAVAERMKLSSFIVFCIVLTGFIYPIQGFWKWGGGFLDAKGFYDFAGSGVVHLTGASAALAAVLLLGPRKGKYGKDGRVTPIPGANLPLAALGTWILWMGWFGFNGGSVLSIAGTESANAVALVLVNTNAAAVGGVLASMVVSKLWFGKVDLTMILNGALAGLVAITAGADLATPLGASLVGALGGTLVVFAIVTLDKLKIDDPVGAISVHGVVGVLGVIAVAFFSDEYTLATQLLGVVTIFLWVFLASFAVWFVLKATVGIRVSEEAEAEGLDLHDCGLEAYPEFTP